MKKCKHVVDIFIRKKNCKKKQKKKRKKKIDLNNRKCN